MNKQQFKFFLKIKILGYRWGEFISVRGFKRLERRGQLEILKELEAFRKIVYRKNIKRPIIKEPGNLYRLLAKIMLTKKSYIKIMEPSITMMQEEYFDYLQEGNTTFALLVKIRFAFIFLFILGLNFPLIKQILDIKEKIAK